MTSRARDCLAARIYADINADAARRLEIILDLCDMRDRELLRMVMGSGTRQRFRLTTAARELKIPLSTLRARLRAIGGKIRRIAAACFTTTN